MHASQFQSPINVILKIIVWVWMSKECFWLILILSLESCFFHSLKKTSCVPIAVSSSFLVTTEFTPSFMIFLCAGSQKTQCWWCWRRCTRRWVYRQTLRSFSRSCLLSYRKGCRTTRSTWVCRQRPTRGTAWIRPLRSLTTSMSVLRPPPGSSGSEQLLSNVTRV